MARSEVTDPIDEGGVELVPGDVPDGIALLGVQHRKVERLFASLLDGPGDEDPRLLFLELADLLSAHTSIEERHFYPALRGAEARELVAESYDDHREVKHLILRLIDLGPEDSDFRGQVEELRAAVAEHVAIEEGELFPRARDLLDQSRLEALGQEMAATLVELQLDFAPSLPLAHAAPEVRP